MNFKLYSYDAIQAMNTTKQKLIEKCLDKSITFDYSLPQGALDNFILDSSLDYGFVLSTTVYVYADDYSGMFSACYEVQRYIENLNYGRAIVK